MGRRDKDDELWKDIKKKVRKRDGNRDRILKIATVKEALFLRKFAPLHFLRILDCAHMKPVGRYPELCYNMNNIYLLNRWSHENLDSCRNPFTGKPITYEEREQFWKRIAGEVVYNHIREQLNKGENEMENESVNQEKPVTLNGQPVTKDELQEKMQDSSCRIVEIEENSFRKLDRMQG